MLDEVREGDMSGAGAGVGKQENVPTSTAATPSASVVGGSFVEQYFKTLANFPDHVHRFYNADSVFSRVEQGATPSSDSSSSSVGQLNIHSMIRSLEFHDCKVLVDSVDCQDSIDGSVLVLVTGLLSNKGQTPRRFVQTVLLARQERGFYVRNDVLRYLDAAESTEEITSPADVAPVSASAVVDDESAAAEVSREEDEEEEEAGEEEPSADDKSVSDIVEAGDEIVERPPEHVVEPAADITATSVPPSTSAAAPPPPSKPASWAALFTSVAAAPASAAAPATAVVAPPPAADSVAEPLPVATPTVATAATTASATGTVQKQSDSESVSQSQLFVSNIPESATAADVREVFEKFGAVSRVDLRDKRNFGFVVFANRDGLTNALQSGNVALHGVELSFEPRRARKTAVGERGGRGRGRFRGAHRFEHRGRGRGAHRRGGGAAAGGFAGAGRDSSSKKQ